MRWGFYGRVDELSQLAQIIRRRHWYFAKMTGRRRIGKTTLIQQAIQAAGGTGSVFCVQIPDSGAAVLLVGHPKRRVAVLGRAGGSTFAKPLLR